MHHSALLLYGNADTMHGILILTLLTWLWVFSHTREIFPSTTAMFCRIDDDAFSLVACTCMSTKLHECFFVIDTCLHGWMEGMYVQQC
jgi:hypothetical protein